MPTDHEYNQACVYAYDTNPSKEAIASDSTGMLSDMFLQPERQYEHRMKAVMMMIDRMSEPDDDNTIVYQMYQVDPKDLEYFRNKKNGNS